MLKFFFRLALGLLAERFIDAISTPEMKFQRAVLRAMGRIQRTMSAAQGSVEQFTVAVERTSRQVAKLADAFNYMPTLAQVAEEQGIEPESETPYNEFLIGMEGFADEKGVTQKTPASERTEE